MPGPTGPVRSARDVADGVLFPRAQETDRARLVPRENLDALRDAGLFGLQGPVDVTGGLGADHVAARPVFEAVAGGCGATAFVWAQHHGAVRRLVGGDGPARDVWLPRLCDGSALAGIGFAYLRRPGPPAVRATRSGSGWRLDGEAPWITGWGLIDVLVLMARADDGTVVTGVVDDPTARASLRPGPPQRLAVMGSTGTVVLRIDGLEVPGGDVAGTQDDETWRLRDMLGSALPPAAPLGIAERSIRILGAATGSGAPEASERLSIELARRRTSADAVALEVQGAVEAAAHGPDRGVVARAVAAGVADRDRGLSIARRASDALVAVCGGRAMSLDHPAQRLSREATFYLIQAQTGALRAASLARAIGGR
jgi:alkylation response protein AidB-like acyl-CoA dehydrogenase